MKMDWMTDRYDISKGITFSGFYKPIGDPVEYSHEISKKGILRRTLRLIFTLIVIAVLLLMLFMTEL